MAKSRDSATSGGLVYSSEHGRMCPDCGQPQAQCRCRSQSSAPSGDGVIRVKLETKGRKGKGVTVVSGLPLADAELTALAKQLKQRCSSGGTAKNGTIEIQGDHRETVSAFLTAQGHKVKR